MAEVGGPGIGNTAFEPHWVQRPGTRVSKVHQVTSLAEAVELVAADPARRVVAGGTDLVVDLARSSGPDIELVDISGLEAAIATSPVDEIARNGWIEIGCGATHNQVLSDPSVVEHALPLAQACMEIGSPQLRNRATIAGNLATASPANDSISALMALGARVVTIRASNGELLRREIALAEFFTGVRSTVLEPGELIERIRVPRSGADDRGVWIKAGLRSAQAISVVHAGLWVRFAGPVVSEARIALGSVAATVVLSSAATSLIGQELTDPLIDEVARLAAASVSPIDDGRATAEYRTETVATVVRRGLRTLASGDHATRWPARVPVLATAATPSAPTLAARMTGVIDDTTEIAVTINGSAMSAAGAASMTLLDWLREHAGTGTKEGCAEGECGACTVMLDGEAVMSCLTPAAQADGGTVVTVEGLADDETLSAMQQSFVDKFAVQCGYCIPGFVVSATALRDEIDDPTREEIELGLSGNLCRCTGYYAILEAVRAAGKDGDQ